MLNLNYSTKEKQVSLPIQKGFWQDKVLADTRQKLAELYCGNPQIFDNPKQVIIEYWKAYEGLPQILEEKLSAFIAWFSTATSPETITRCTRALKEDRTIAVDTENSEQRKEQEQQWRGYWGNDKRLRRNNGQE